MVSKEQTKAQVDELFTKTMDDWARYYADPKPATLNANNLVSRRRFALEMIEARLPAASKVLDIGCGTGHLAAELMRRGYTPGEIKKVAGLNLLRVFREVENVSARLRESQ